MSKKKKPKKATNRLIDQAYLNARSSQKFGKQKWIVFCETLLKYGLTIRLYEARQTFSKYITVTEGEKEFKVRFSNHKPIHAREINGDCDFFVGVTNLGVSTTPQAVFATLTHFGKTYEDTLTGPPSTGTINRSDPEVRTVLS